MNKSPFLNSSWHQVATKMQALFDAPVEDSNRKEVRVAPIVLASCPGARPSIFIKESLVTQRLSHLNSNTFLNTFHSHLNPHLHCLSPSCYLSGPGVHLLQSDQFFRCDCTFVLVPRLAHSHSSLRVRTDENNSLFVLFCYVNCFHRFYSIFDDGFLNFSHHLRHRRISASSHNVPQRRRASHSCSCSFGDG